MSSQYGHPSWQRYELGIWDKGYGLGLGINESQALEGKDLKDIILNIGAGGGAAAAPAAGGAADASGAPAEAAKEEEKEEGKFTNSFHIENGRTNAQHREGRVRRRHGIRTFRLSIFTHALRVFLHQLPVGSASSCISPQWEKGKDGFKNGVGRVGLCLRWRYSF
jgi:hypothetical protein